MSGLVSEVVVLAIVMAPPHFNCLLESQVGLLASRHLSSSVQCDGQSLSQGLLFTTTFQTESSHFPQCRIVLFETCFSHASLHPTQWRIWQASTVGLSPGRGRVVTAVKPPHPAHLSSRHITGGSICIDVQRRRWIIAEPRLLTKRATAHVQLCTNCVVETNVPSDRFPGVSFPSCFPTFSPDGGGQSPVIRRGGH